MYFELPDCVIKASLSHAQIEITGACNMNCAHCRASTERPIFLGEETIDFILNFACSNMNEHFNLTVSGGEPLLHPRFVDIMRLIRSYPLNEIVVTTNGSLIDSGLLNALDSLQFPNLTLQLSLDSTEPRTHDKNRGYAGAYDLVLRALSMIQDYRFINSSIRMTVTRETHEQIGNMIELAKNLNVSRLGVGTVIPAGRGMSGELVFTPEEKRNLLNKLASYATKWLGEIEIVTEDPLKCLIKPNPWIPQRVYDLESNPYVFGGCTAGIDCFNLNTFYQITPCSVFPEPIVDDIRHYRTVDELTKAYESSQLVKDLCMRSFSGYCNQCSHKHICGGCRAQANYSGSNFLASDGTCWYKGGEMHEGQEDR